MPPAGAVPGGRRLAAALTAGGAVPAAPPAPLYKPPGRGLAGSLSPAPRVAVDAQWKSAPGSCRGAPVSCESAHALPSPQPSALFFFLYPCIFPFYCCFFPSVTPFPHFLPPLINTHTHFANSQPPPLRGPGDPRRGSAAGGRAGARRRPPSSSPGGGQPAEPLRAEPPRRDGVPGRAELRPPPPQRVLRRDFRGAAPGLLAS